MPSQIRNSKVGNKPATTPAKIENKPETVTKTAAATKTVTPLTAPAKAAPATTPSVVATAPAAKVEAKVEVKAPAITTPAVTKAPVATETRPAAVVATSKGASKPTATVKFTKSWGNTVEGALLAGGKFTVEYDPARLPSLRNTHNGFPAWGITAYVQFQPSKKISEGSVVQFGSEGGKPTNNAKGQPLTLDIPEGTTALQIWFRNWTGADAPRESYDSNFGRNYRFEVKK